MIPIETESVKGIISPEKIALIRAGLMGVSFHLPHDEVFIFPFMDYLYLLFQPTEKENPIVFLFWEKDACIYSSFSDMYYAKKYQLESLNNLAQPKFGIKLSSTIDLWFSVHRVSRETLENLEAKHKGRLDIIALSESDFEAILPPDDDLTAKVALLLERPKNNLECNWLGLSDDEINQFEELLVRSIKVKRTTYPWRPEQELDIIDIDYKEEMLPHLDGFRKVLDKIFEDASASKAMRFRNHSLQLNNVFCVIRTVTSKNLRLGVYPYTAGLLLSENQREILRSWCDDDCIGKKSTSCPVECGANKNCLSDIETPLGNLSRSVADIVFCSGVIDFGRQPNDQIWDYTDPDNIAEQRRRKAENCIYPKNDNASLYYVPIHIEGIPWLSIFTFSPSNNSDDRWVHNYTFYRDIIQRAASLLRQEVRQEYLHLVSKTATQYIDNWSCTPNDICIKVNNIWEVLARIYPFPFLRLSHSSDETSTSNNATKTIGQWNIQCLINPFFGPPQVRWGITSPEDLLEALVSTLKLQMAQRWEVLEESGQSRAKIAHAIDAQLDSLGTAIYEVGDIQAKMALNKEWNCLRDFANLSMAEIDDRRKTAILNDFQTKSIPLFIDYINDLVHDILLRLTNQKIARGNDVKKRAEKIIASDHNIIGDPVCVELKEIKYYPSHVKAVVFELIINALRRLNDMDMKFDTNIAFDTKEHGIIRVIFQVYNTTNKSRGDLIRLCDELSNGTGPHLGIMNIRTFCRLWDYTQAKWSPVVSDATNGIEASCQIGTIYLMNML